MLKMMEATRILIDPCEEKKYSGQTQAHIYSQILGLGLELEIEISITDGFGSVCARIQLTVFPHLSVMVTTGLEPVPSDQSTFHSPR